MTITPQEMQGYDAIVLLGASANNSTSSNILVTSYSPTPKWHQTVAVSGSTGGSALLMLFDTTSNAITVKASTAFWARVDVIGM